MRISVIIFPHFASRQQFRDVQVLFLNPADSQRGLFSFVDSRNLYGAISHSLIEAVLRSSLIQNLK